MTNYEIALLAGSILLLLAMLSIIASLTDKRSLKWAVIFCLAGGGALYYAQISNFDDLNLTVSKGITLADIPDALYKLIGKALN